VKTVALGLACLLWMTAVGADESARADYMLNCQGCHLPDATGREPYVPNMVGQLGRLVAVPGGRAYLVQVPGTANAPLSDAEIAALLNWMLREFSAATLPAEFLPYTEAEVAEYRAVRAVDIVARRRGLVIAMGNEEPLRDSRD
jgi:mono/diheme cytochrome c family protein